MASHSRYLQLFCGYLHVCMDYVPDPVASPWGSGESGPPHLCSDPLGQRVPDLPLMFRPLWRFTKTVETFFIYLGGGTRVRINGGLGDWTPTSTFQLSSPQLKFWHCWVEINFPTCPYKLVNPTNWSIQVKYTLPKASKLHRCTFKISKMFLRGSGNEPEPESPKLNPWFHLKCSSQIVLQNFKNALECPAQIPQPIPLVASRLYAELCVASVQTYWCTLCELSAWHRYARINCLSNIFTCHCFSDKSVDICWNLADSTLWTNKKWGEIWNLQTQKAIKDRFWFHMYTRFNNFKFKFWKKSGDGLTEPPCHRPLLRSISGCALGSSFALNSWALRTLSSGISLDTCMGASDLTRNFDVCAPSPTDIMTSDRPSPQFLTFSITWGYTICSPAKKKTLYCIGTLPELLWDWRLGDATRI